MMEIIKIDWKNCFGIKQLEHEFKFEKGKPIHLIYAPNGSMKTSFAKTMKFLSGQSKEKPCDKLRPYEESKCDVFVDDKINRYLKSKSEKSVANRLTKCSLRCIFLLASRQRKP